MSHREVDWFAIPKVVVFHMVLCVVSFVVALIVDVAGAPAGRRSMVFALLLAWNLILILLYGRFLRQRQAWARYVLGILTFPMGLLLLVRSAGEYGDA